MITVRRRKRRRKVKDEITAWADTSQSLSTLTVSPDTNPSNANATLVQIHQIGRKPKRSFEPERQKTPCGRSDSQGRMDLFTRIAAIVEDQVNGTPSHIGGKG